MSLIDISHPDTSAHDELVPSRYALKVGDIDVMVISDGVLPITAVTMATNAAPDDLSTWLKDMFPFRLPRCGRRGRLQVRACGLGLLTTGPDSAQQDPPREPRYRSPTGEACR